MRRITLGNLDLDRDRVEVRIGERRVDLTFTEFELLCRLARRPGRVVPQEELIGEVWGGPSEAHAGRLRVQMSRLRKKIRGSWPWTIRTVHKRGYVLAEGGTEGQPSSRAYPDVPSQMRLEVTRGG